MGCPHLSSNGDPLKMIAGKLEIRLLAAIRNGNLSGARRLIKQGADVNWQSKPQCTATALHEAARMDDVPIVELLISEGADIDAKRQNNYTPLHIAAFFGMARAAQALLRNGADVNANDDSGATPLQLAVLRGHDHVARLLACGVADPKVKQTSDGKPTTYPAKQDVPKLLSGAETEGEVDVAVLFSMYKDHRGTHLLDRIIKSYLPLAKQELKLVHDEIVLSERELVDVRASAIFGLMDAIGEFDIFSGDSFEATATWRIRNAISEELLEVD